MNISGIGTIPAGEYNQKISISGDCKIDGNVRCPEFFCAGIGKVKGNIDCSGEVHISGSMTSEGYIIGESVAVSGICEIKGSCIAKDELRISGFLKTKSVKAATLTSKGIIIAKEGIEAEKAKISSVIECAGLFNAETIEIVMTPGSSNNKIGSIGGSDIKIYSKISSREKPDSRILLLSKVVDRFSGFTITHISESIEGDVIALENVKAPLVVGRIVAVGAGCDIGLVQYSEAIEIDPDAKVEKQEKI